MAGINCTIIWHHVLHIKCKNVGICISCVCVSRAIWSVSDDLAILLQELVQMLIYFATGVPRVYSRFYDKIMQGIEKKGRFAKWLSHLVSFIVVFCKWCSDTKILPNRILSGHSYGFGYPSYCCSSFALHINRCFLWGLQDAFQRCLRQPVMVTPAHTVLVTFYSCNYMTWIIEGRFVVELQLSPCSQFS